MPNAYAVVAETPAARFYVGGERLYLTHREGDLLTILAREFGRYVGYDDIARGLLGAAHPSETPKRVVQTTVTTLRKRLESGRTGLVIENWPGEGYRLTRPPPAPHEHLALLDRPGEAFEIVHYRGGAEAGRLRLDSWLAAFHLATLIQERVGRKIRAILGEDHEADRS